MTRIDEKSVYIQFKYGCKSVIDVLNTYEVNIQESNEISPLEVISWRDYASSLNQGAENQMSGKRKRDYHDDYESKKRFRSSSKINFGEFPDCNLM